MAARPERLLKAARESRDEHGQDQDATVHTMQPRKKTAAKKKAAPARKTTASKNRTAKQTTTKKTAAARKRSASRANAWAGWSWSCRGSLRCSPPRAALTAVGFGQAA